ncbi:Carbohydrate-binding module family 13 protein [Ceratobasidium theobromae]|uniref:Carbohydrate-binding module family 13 protein n=1 Tax=Ceratobasidium theobromae TaxID=1582974 RepID=A0A5N5QCD1_9AGAM|nr:Carbohydrate-binding module family 13 protein [Ceratobasidium theobromae]
MRSLSILASVLVSSVAAQYTATWDPANLPDTTEADQSGTNKCGTGNSQDSMCQNLYVNSASDFCIWGPPKPDSVIGEIEQIVVAYCTTPGRGTRLMPEGTLKSAHFLKTPDYVQVTGVGDFTKIGIRRGDEGGELDPHGADKLGNPHGGLVFSNAFEPGSSGLGVQMHEWTNFQSATEFCIRACKDGPMARRRCQHIYDILGCGWNIPGQYGDGFTNCEGESTIPMGLYPQPDGSTSTFRQGQPKTPPAHPAGSSSLCTTIQSFAVGTAVVRTAVPTTTRAAASGAWTTGTPTGTAASSNNAPIAAPLAGGLGLALTSVVVAALGAGLYIL